jgi:CHAT domain-containing protein
MLDGADALRARSEKEPLEQSIEQYRRLIVMADAERLDDIAARSRLGAGVALELLGRSPEALPLLRDAHIAFRTLSDRAREAEALTWYAVVANRTGDSSAAEKAQNGLALARAAGDRRVEAVALTAIYWTSNGSKDAGIKAGLERAVTIQRDRNDRRGLAEALNALGLFTQGVDGPKAAIPIYEEALRSAREAGDARQIGFALSLLGYASYEIGEHDRAIAYDQESVILSRRAGDRIQESYTLGTLGLALRYTGHVRAALTVFQQQLAIIRALGDRTREGSTINNVAMALEGLGRRAEAAERFEQALKIHRLNKDVGEEAVTLMGFAFLRQSIGDHHGSLELSQRALALSLGTDNLRAQSSAYQYVGFSLAALGRYAEASEAYDSGLQVARQLGDRAVESQCERLLGRLFALLGDTRAALVHFERSIARSNGAAQRAANLAHTAALKGEVGDRAGAQRLLDEAATLVKQTTDFMVQARVQNAAGMLAMIRGDYRQAIRLFEEEWTIRQRSNDKSGQASLQTQIGQAYAALGNRSRALESFRQALSSSHAARNPAAEAVALTSLMRHWRDQRQLPVAVFFGKQAVNLFQQTRVNLLQLEPGIQRAYVDSRAHVYRELADLLIQGGRLLEAQQVVDLLKQEEYFDFVRRDQGQVAAERRTVDVTAREAASIARYKEIQDHIVALGQTRAELLGIQLRTPAQERELSSVEADLTVANETFSQFLRRLAADLTLNALATNQLVAVRDAQAFMPTLRELGPGTVAVYTLLTETSYVAMVITPDARKAVERPIAQADLQRRIFGFRQALQDPRVDPRGPAQQLYTILVGPIARELEQARATTVLWVLDGVLRYVPVVALHDGRQYVAEKYRSVVFTPASHPNLRDLPSRRWEGLGAGVSRPTAGFSGLPAVLDELRRIFREPEGGSGGIMTGRLLLDDAFTAEAFRSSLRDRLPVVHVATHFQLNPGDDNQSFLLLGDGSRLTVADLRRAPNIFEGVELLTISACNTAIGGASGDGSEFESFGAWAQLNGAKAVVASLWPVADASTQEFMQAFYRARVDGGLDKAQAIQQAQLALLNGGSLEKPAASATTAASSRGLTGLSARGPLPAFVPPPEAPWSHPFYWAPFVLIGNFR